MGDDRPSVYVEDGITVLRASSLGRCVASTWYAKEGYPKNKTSDAVLTAWEAGNVWEDRVIAAGMENHPDLRLLTFDELNELGFTLAGRGDDQIPQVELELRHNDRLVRCHPDGIAMDENGQIVVIEAKFVGESLWSKMKKGDLGTYYSWQASIEALGVAEVLGEEVPLLYIVCLKAIDALNKDVVGIANTHTFWIDEPKHTLEDLWARVDMILVDEPPECDQRMWGCEYYPMCDLDVLPAITDGLALAAARDYAEADRQYKVAAAARKAARERLIASLDETLEESHTVGEVTVSISERRGSVDMEKLCNDHPEVDPEKYRKKPSQVVSLSVPQEPKSSD